MSKLIYKSDEDIEQIRKSADVLSRTLAEIAKEIEPGVKTIDLDKLAFTFIQDHGGTPAFLNYNGFPYSLCISVNDQIVHGFPGSYELKEGDIISVDGGVVLNGYISDSAYTFSVGAVSAEVEQLLRVTKESLDKGVEQAVVGKRVGDISFAVQEHVRTYGYGIVKELVGHGVGIHLHEKPEVPNYGQRGKGTKLERGMVIAIEPMINLGKAGVRFWEDGWTVSTIDEKPSAHFEHTVAVSKGKADVLTTFSYIEEVLNKKG
ncbi:MULTISPECIES: type I methionyl aminopeptidase [Olivibacter]|jgi:methionyl aminopeptidase|uniref:Methionine aminopeptidase n=3 Tax=Sphingobacteriaceae TaxID=84566 RepID=F4C826_SPHS2|nr:MULTISPECIES: type I methionyl aminopeptidase [Olivibacter]MCL4641515.1 type I methionyl aminopeptidase [Olivibacter sp. UJ_SKK_5.1]MDM8177140.1 type I methionyl aminopeptidase [Olivibacter sp. 47]MDX3912588.1 type I methionyl aminopeptidase [Pseudosphingobacterium sp.]